MTTQSDTENKKAENKKINIKDIDLNALSMAQIMELLAKKEEAAKAEVQTAINDSLKAVETNKDIKKVFERTSFVKMVVFINEETGKVKAQYFEKKVDTKQHAEDGRASKTIMTIHDMAGKCIMEVKNTKKKDQFYQYLKDNIPEFKDSPISIISEKFKENSEQYLTLLQNADSNKFRIVK